MTTKLQKTDVLYAWPGSMNLRLVSDEKCDWLRAQFGIELTDAPSCQGRLAVVDEQGRVMAWRAP